MTTVARSDAAAAALKPRLWGGLTRRMLLASALLMLILAAAFAALLVTVADLRDSARAARDSQEVLTTGDELERLIIDLETGVRGFVITGQEQFLEPYVAARRSLPTLTAMLERLSAGDANQERRSGLITDAANSYVEAYAVPLIDAVRRGDPAARGLAATAEGKRRVDEMRGYFDEFIAAERQVAQVGEQRADDAARRAVLAAVGGLAASMLLVLLLAGYLARAFVQPVRRTAQMAVRLAGGDLSTRMPATGTAEIGQLERAFNEMAGSLERNLDELAELAAEQAALRRVATLVARRGSAPAVFSVVAEEIAQRLDADIAVLLRYEPDDTATIVGGWSARSSGIPVGSRLTVEGNGVAVSVLRTRRPAREEHFEGPLGSIAACLAALGVHAGVGSPIVVEGRLWGVAIATWVRHEQLPDGSEDRIQEFTELVATAIANTESRTELAASRARVVAAADETRRQLERDLHDGAQQRLVSMALRLKLAATAIPPNFGEAHQELASVGSEMDEVLSELRELSRGIHPAILTEGGLGPALRSLARRSPVPVELHVGADDRLPERAEVTAYYVVSEALTNVVKHADASEVRVDVDVEDGVVRLAIGDDGIGGADPARGSGLIGLKDRVEATGGTLRVQSSPGRGTSLVVELPINPGHPTKSS